MYEVFINEHCIFLTNKIVKETNFKQFLLINFSIEEVIAQLSNGDIASAHLYHPSRDELLVILKKTLPVVVAAGGLVMNEKDEMLFIYRNKKWDLPKGKVDKGETLKAAAIREIEEETGVKKLEIQDFRAKTYHIFKRNGVYKLKETHWFTMKTAYDGKLIPEHKEGITKAVWKDENQIKKALKNSYPSIKKLLK